MSLTFTSAQHVIVNVVEQLLLLIQRLLLNSVVDVTVASDEPRAETVLN